jgi:hypothetical protein
MFNQVVTLKAGQSDLSVQVIEKGLHVFSISFNDKNGKKQEIIIGPEDPKDQVKDRRVSDRGGGANSYLSSDSINADSHCTARLPKLDVILYRSL